MIIVQLVTSSTLYFSGMYLFCLARIISCSSKNNLLEISLCVLFVYLLHPQLLRLIRCYRTLATACMDKEQCAATFLQINYRLLAEKRILLLNFDWDILFHPPQKIPMP